MLRGRESSPETRIWVLQVGRPRSAACKKHPSFQRAAPCSQCNWAVGTCSSQGEPGDGGRRCLPKGRLSGPDPNNSLGTGVKFEERIGINVDLKH